MAGSDAEGTESRTDESTDLPKKCPTSQGLTIDWPEELDTSTVEPFVEEYESAYYRNVVVEYEDSRFSSYELSGQVSSGPTQTDSGYVLTYTGDGEIYHTILMLHATTSEPPDGADIVQMNAIDDSRLTDLLSEAAETGNANDDVPDTETQRYVDLLASLSEDFDLDPENTLYVDVENTTVALTTETLQQHGDYGWTAWYYINESVVRRTTEEEIEPQNGTVVECRPGE